jgi:hypothetical protein
MRLPCREKPEASGSGGLARGLVADRDELDVANPTVSVNM